MKYENMFRVSKYKSKKKLPLVTTSQVKHLVNASKKFILIMVKIGALGEVNVMLLVVYNTYFRPSTVYKREG